MVLLIPRVGTSKLDFIAMGALPELPVSSFFAALFLYRIVLIFD
jgi:hypothetical protein